MDTGQPSGDDRLSVCAPVWVWCDMACRWVGVRCPELRLARDFLDEARVPVVAPSANRYMHVWGWWVGVLVGTKRGAMVMHAGRRQREYQSRLC